MISNLHKAYQQYLFCLLNHLSFVIINQLNKRVYFQKILIISKFVQLIVAPYLIEENMLRKHLSRQTSLQIQEIDDENETESNHEKSVKEQKECSPQLIQKAFINNQTDYSMSQNNSFLPLSHTKKQINKIQRDVQVERIRQTQNRERVDVKLRNKQSLVIQNQYEGIHQIHHTFQPKKIHFSRMFSGKTGIRGQNDRISNYPTKSLSLQKKKVQFPLAITKNNSFYKPQIVNFDANEMQKILQRKQQHIKLMQQRCYSKQSLKQNREQEERIQQLLIRAKQKIQKEQLFKLTYDKQRVLDIKLRQRIRSDLGHEKLKNKIEKACEKIKALSLSKKKQSQSNSFLKKERFELRKLLKKQEEINKFKNMLQSRVVNKLVIR